jgi:hypothetical protein
VPADEKVRERKKYIISEQGKVYGHRFWLAWFMIEKQLFIVQLCEIFMDGI